MAWHDANALSLGLSNEGAGGGGEWVPACLRDCARATCEMQMRRMQSVHEAAGSGMLLLARWPTPHPLNCAAADHQGAVKL